jgi:hypothetical protein
MDNILIKLKDIVDILTEINRRLDKIDMKIDDLGKETPINVQQDVKMKTAIRGLLTAARKL